jgi:uncharacterized protein
MASDNVELLKGTYEAFGRGDIPAVMASFAEDIEWNAPEVLPHGGSTRGHEGVGAFFQRLGSTWEGFGLELQDFVGDEDRVCVTGRASGKLDGSDTGYGFVHSWTMRDGVAVRFDEYVDPEPELYAG